MVVLPLACKSCGRRLDLNSDEPMPKCPDCHGKMGPAGPVREEKPEQEARPWLTKSK